MIKTKAVYRLVREREREKNNMFNSHHQDEGAQAFCKSLTHQEVSYVEHLHHFVHENLLPSHDATDTVKVRSTDKDEDDEQTTGPLSIH